MSSYYFGKHLISKAEDIKDVNFLILEFTTRNEYDGYDNKTSYPVSHINIYAHTDELIFKDHIKELTTNKSKFKISSVKEGKTSLSVDFTF